MPDGSSSDAPVTRPGPSNNTNRLIRLCSRPSRISRDSGGNLTCGIRERFAGWPARTREFLPDFAFVMIRRLVEHQASIDAVREPVPHKSVPRLRRGRFDLVATSQQENEEQQASWHAHQPQHHVPDRAILLFDRSLLTKGI